MRINGKEVVMPYRQRTERRRRSARKQQPGCEGGGRSRSALTARTSLDDLPDYRMKSGRPLQPGDEGQHRIMLRESFATEEFGIKTGDRLLFLFENDPGKEDDVLIQVRVVGIISRTSEQTGLESAGQPVGAAAGGADGQSEARRDRHDCPGRREQRRVHGSGARGAVGCAGCDRV